MRAVWLHRDGLALGRMVGHLPRKLWLRTASRCVGASGDFCCQDFDSLFETTKRASLARLAASGRGVSRDGRSIKSRLFQRARLPAVGEEGDCGKLAPRPPHGRTARKWRRVQNRNSALLNNQVTLTIDTTEPACTSAVTGKPTHTPLEERWRPP